MSYLGYTGLFSAFCENLGGQLKNRPVQILEIGVDKGQTALPLLHNLLSRNVNFLFHGIDIRQDDLFLNQIFNMDGVIYDQKDKKCNYFYNIINSLDYLPQIKNEPPEQNPAFDLILLDGDHNYQTVVKELNHINELSHEYSLIAIDDYSGKFAKKDMFYSEHSGYEHLDHKDLKNKSKDKQGVATAVNDFVTENPAWHITDLVSEDEVVFLTQKIKMQNDGEGGIEIGW